MIYIDPPFFSGSDYSLRLRPQDENASGTDVQDIPTFSDRWENDIDHYCSFMRPRLELMHTLLREDGSLWVHLDWHVSHYIKVMLDEIFGYHSFVNEIVWKRTNSPKAQTEGFGSQHDIILLYARNPSSFRFRTVYREHDAVSTRPYIYHDERGRFRLVEIEAQGIQRTPDRRRYEWRGRVAPYLYRKETLDRWWDEGLIYVSKNGRYSKKQYLSERVGVPVSDLWLDIPPLQGSSSEYTGFLTQKPVALLSRMIECATDRGDIVADFFAGSGTTGVAAEVMGRRWILCDVSEVAIRLCERRLQEVSSEASTFTVMKLDD
ncbi:MAG: site-specific DNA-methyltransferase [Candidatus Thorarchaeota archaeon]